VQFDYEISNAEFMDYLEITLTPKDSTDKVDFKVISIEKQADGTKLLAKLKINGTSDEATFKIKLKDLNTNPIKFSQNENIIFQQYPIE
jgi:polyisoprenoid-binding protein YceI